MAEGGSASAPAEDMAWRYLLEVAQARRGGLDEPPLPAGIDGGDPLLDFYLPLLARARIGSFVVAHLGQSLDGRIATRNGESRYVTGMADIVHNHRMRALFDVVLVGAETVRLDDPRLTVRQVPGDNPVRVAIDPNRMLAASYHIFSDEAAPTLLVCAEDCVNGDSSHGAARIVGAPRDGDGLDLGGVLRRLADRGHAAVFVEGGGVTVSRFLAAGALDRLQITVAPMIIGAGRMGIDLPQITSLAQGLRPPVRRLDLGDDVLFECLLDD